MGARLRQTEDKKGIEVSEHALVPTMLANAVGFGHGELPALAALDGHLNGEGPIVYTRCG